MTPHKCPVCDGTGLVSRPPFVAGDTNEWSSSSCGPWSCRACNGCGVLWANDSTEIIHKVNAGLDPLVAKAHLDLRASNAKEVQP